jgi:Arc/MetJ-type ribon-helix-helix transcriptional regulator
LKLKNNQRTVLANIDNGLVEWIDQQVKAGNYRDRNEVVETAINHFKKSRTS